MNSFNPARVEVQQLIDTAKAHSAQGKRDAHELWRAAAQRASELLGPTHDATAYCQNNVGKALVDIGNYDEAIPLLETALRQAQAIHGYVHFAVEHICQSLARAYKQKGDLANAHKYWLAAATSSESIRGLHHSTTIFCLHQGARTLASQRRFAEALPLFRKVLEANVAMYGQSIHTAFALRDTATCCNQLERVSEAVPLWKRAHKLFKKELGKEDIARSTYRCLNWTREKVRAAVRAEQLQVLAAVQGLSEEERHYLVGLNMTHKQLGAVLEHLKKTYLTGDDGEYQYADNLRVAVKTRFTQVHAYHELKRSGCCGEEDVELLVIGDHGSETILVGFNFGH